MSPSFTYLTQGAATRSVIFRAALLLSLLAFSPHSFTVDRAILPPIPLDFELSNGEEFVRLSQLQAQQLTLVNFWRSDCPPCLSEMPLLHDFARRGRLQLITIALEKPTETRQNAPGIPPLLHPPVIALQGPATPAGLLRRFGNPSMALPYSLILDPKGQPCARQLGAWTEARLNQALSQCAAPPR